jgi:hypothetical protein
MSPAQKTLAQIARKRWIARDALERRESADSSPVDQGGGENRGYA